MGWEDIMKKRFATDNGSNEDVTLIDNLTGVEYEDNFEDVVELLNKLSSDIIVLEKTLFGGRCSHDIKKLKELEQEFLSQVVNCKKCRYYEYDWTIDDDIGKEISVNNCAVGWRNGKAYTIFPAECGMFDDNG